MSDHGTALPTPSMWYSLPKDTQLRVALVLGTRAIPLDEITLERLRHLRDCERLLLLFRDELIDAEGLKRAIEGMENHR